MLVKLHARGLRPLGKTSVHPFVARITEDRTSSSAASEILLVRNDDGPLSPGFRGYFLHTRRQVEDGCMDVFVLAHEHLHLGERDVVRVDPRRRTIGSLYRRGGTNSFLVTERCDNYCVMCSQPPKERDDAWLIDDVFAALPLIEQEAPEIGITGGEPTLLGDRFLALLARSKEQLPRTAVHVLSNGRRFADREFARQVSAIAHPDLMIGIPLYSDLPEEHDFVVQARGAFNETVRGILNLKRVGVRVELRFVIHAETYRRMPEFAAFVARNLPVVDQVSLMGLELMGFARSNLASVWVDPVDYQPQLTAATITLAKAGLRVVIFNHQLCVLPQELHRYAVKSISDWKNAYHADCDGCTLKTECGGFFESSKVRRSRGIRPRL